MTTVIIGFIGASVLLYVLFGGADYGAGILELFKGRRRREDQENLIGVAMGPVWEANHIWLILTVVIMFMGFPQLFTTMSIALHLPLMAVLVGIVLRGCAFTFRHYDAIKDGSQRVYSWIFSLSSVWTAVWLGVVAGSLALGRINLEPTAGYHESYIAPWLSWFTFAFGVFTAAIFTFLSAVYLIGETKDSELKSMLIFRAECANVATIVSGAALFFAAYSVGLDWPKQFFTHPWSVIAFLCATAVLVPLWRALKKGRVWTTRTLAGFQIGCVLAGWYALNYPDVMRIKTARGVESLTFYEAAAPEATQKQLLIALIVGLLLIGPALLYLLKVFKSEGSRRTEEVSES